jgi:hypothetical protein
MEAHAIGEISGCISSAGRDTASRVGESRDDRTPKAPRTAGDDRASSFEIELLPAFQSPLSNFRRQFHELPHFLPSKTHYTIILTFSIDDLRIL